MVGVGDDCWYVVRTRPHSEAIAAENLERRGVCVYLPWIATVPGWGRRAAADPQALEPLFPGYLFARLRLADQYHRAAWTPGVRGFVTFGDGVPEPLPEDVVDCLRQRAGGGNILRPQRLTLRPGEAIEVRGGPFAGLLGTVDRPLDASGRVRVLLEILRRQTRVDLSANDVARL